MKARLFEEPTRQGNVPATRIVGSDDLSIAVDLKGRVVGSVAGVVKNDSRIALQIGVGASLEDLQKPQSPWLNVRRLVKQGTNSGYSLGDSFLPRALPATSQSIFEQSDVAVENLVLGSNASAFGGSVNGKVTVVGESDHHRQMRRKAVRPAAGGDGL